MTDYDFLVIGGGAAGFFAAINSKLKNPELKVGILEKTSKVLQKVKVSGGGRCNVTNKVSDPKELSGFYPRGKEFLVGPFTVFNSQHTQEWFAKQNVKLKTETDGRVFPVSDSSQTIINCFERLSQNIDIRFNSRVESFSQKNENWYIYLKGGESLSARKIMVATGSDKSVWATLLEFGLKIKPEVPSLFTFNIQDQNLVTLAGTSFKNAIVRVKGSNLMTNGPMLITHWGLSGPAILKLSAWGALELAAKEYQFEIQVNWLGDTNKNELTETLKQSFANNPKKNIRSIPLFGFSQRFWTYLCDLTNIGEFQKGAEAGKKQMSALLDIITKTTYKVTGKSTFKEEFVTAGGVDLSEIKPETFEVMRLSGMFMGGEVLDIDAITGGFNFQAAWTAGWIISESIAQL